MKLCVVLDANNIVTNYGVCLDDTHMPFVNGVIVYTDLDLDVIEIVGNYKVAEGVLVELADEENQITETKPTVSQRIAVLQEKISVLQTQVPLQISELEAQICELVFADMEGDED